MTPCSFSSSDNQMFVTNCFYPSSDHKIMVCFCDKLFFIILKSLGLSICLENLEFPKEISNTMDYQVISTQYSSFDWNIIWFIIFYIYNFFLAKYNFSNHRIYFTYYSTTYTWQYVACNILHQFLKTKKSKTVFFNSACMNTSHKDNKVIFNCI